MTTGKFTPTPVTGKNPGETWAGRGRKPKWLKAQEAAENAAETSTAPAAVNAPAVIAE